MRALAIALLAAVPAAGWAGELVSGFQKALAADPAYQAAKAEYEVNRLASERAGRAYWPELGFKTGERTEVSGQQTTIQIAQPVVDAERYATWRGAQPLGVRALATMRQREADLLQRYYKAVADLVRAREQLELNAAKTRALEEQARAARAALAKGTGTVTDVYDTEIRLSLARAEALTLQANRDAALRQYQVQTGEPPPERAFTLARARRTLPLQPLQSLLEAAEATNPQVVAAVQTEKLAELEVTRRYGAFLPKVNAIAKQTRTADGQSASFAGINIELPLQSGTLLDIASAKAGLAKASEEVRAARARVRLEVQRLYELVSSARQEISIRLEAIEAAAKGLVASEKSFRGGVRSQIDVLNSIQTLYQTQDEYVAAVLNLGTNFIALHTFVDTPSLEVLGELERFLF